MENLRLLQSRENKISKEFLRQNMELVFDTPKSQDMESFFGGTLTYSELITRLIQYIPFLENEDEVKRKVYLSGGMGRLAMSEWDDSISLDAPIYKNEIELFKRIIKNYLKVNLSKLLINRYYEDLLDSYINGEVKEDFLLSEFNELVINMELATNPATPYEIFIANRELNILKDFIRGVLFLD